MQKTMPKNRYDQLNKALLDHPPMVDDLLRIIFLPQHTDFFSQLDFITLSQLPDGWTILSIVRQGRCLLICFPVWRERF